MRKVRWSAVTAVALFTMTGLSVAGGTAMAAPSKPAVAYTAQGSINEAYVVNATEGEKLTLVTKAGKKAGTGTVDRLGSFVFHGLKPGPGYVVKGPKGVSKAFKVLKAGDNPKRAFYEKTELKQGLNYVKMRDGIELAMTVRLPAGKTLADGPFPTFIEHSGYETAAPHDLLGSVVASLTGGGGANDPLAPATSTAVGSVLGPLLGFAVVSVQMRGSGCSGGAFDLFNLPTTYDGYDMVETVAAQPWVKGNKVGMGGISFSGISQLFAAGTQPPHLAAVTPMSVTDDIYTATGYPGGIFNSGFALSWIKARASDAQPAPEGGQGWAKALVAAGDQHCIDNQKLRLQTIDVFKTIQDNPYRTPGLFAARSPGAWVKKIKAPVFLIGQFQDEQTGGHFPESLAPLAKNKRAWITLQNGVHADSLGPSTVTRWVEFLNLYVADEVPKVPAVVRALAPQLYEFLADAGSSPVADTRFAGRNVTVEQARAEYEKDARVQILMDNGAGPSGPGSIGATWKLDFGQWPVKSLKPTNWFLGAGGALAATKPAAGTAKYTGDPSARPAQTLEGPSESDSWKAQPKYNWAPVAAGKGLGFTSPVLTKDLVIVGPGSADLYVKSSAADTDLQVAISEVRPDGKETLVQNGWLRASHRKLDAKASTAVDPVPTHLKQDAAPLPKGKYSLLRVPIFPMGHAFRAGSRVRMVITAPGGDRQIWRFDTVEKGSTQNTIALGGVRPSKLVLPVIPGATAQGTPLPGPTSLRGQPSRTYATASNGG